MANVLVACVATETSERLRALLESGGHWVKTVPPADAAAAVDTHRPDLVLVEPGPSAAPRLVARLKAARKTRRLPVIVLGHVNDPADAPPEAAVPTGAPGIDFLSLVKRFVKPPPGPDRRFLRYGDLELDRDGRSVRFANQGPVRLPIHHFSLMWMLIQRATESREVCTRDALVAKVWKKRVRDREVDVTISRLKSRLPFLADRLESVPGKGYRFVLPPR